MSYVLDANDFIEAKKRFYAFDICPAYWTWLDSGVTDGTLTSIDKVKVELLGRGDDLSDWAKDRPHLFAASDVPSVVPSLTVVAEWAEDQKATGRYTDAAVSDFLSVADYHLVAYAHANNLILVTLEVSEPTRHNKVKIPDACSSLGVQCINLYDMLRAENARFVLPP